MGEGGQNSSQKRRPVCSIFGQGLSLRP